MTVNDLIDVLSDCRDSGYGENDVVFLIASSSYAVDFVSAGIAESIADVDIVKNQIVLYPPEHEEQNNDIT